MKNSNCKYLFLLIFVLAAVTGQAQIVHSSISGSANMWTNFAGLDVNLSYDRGNIRNFVSVGVIGVISRTRIELPPNIIPHPGSTYFKGPADALRYGAFAEYGIFPLAADSAPFRPYFSAILATRFYGIEPSNINTSPEFGVWENELNIGYGLRVQIIDRLALFSRFGIGLLHTSYNPSGPGSHSNGSKFNTHFDFRVGTIYYLRR